MTRGGFQLDVQLWLVTGLRILLAVQCKRHPVARHQRNTVIWLTASSQPIIAQPLLDGRRDIYNQELPLLIRLDKDPSLDNAAE